MTTTNKPEARKIDMTLWCQNLKSEITRQKLAVGLIEGRARLVDELRDTEPDYWLKKRIPAPRYQGNKEIEADGYSGANDSESADDSPRG